MKRPTRIILEVVFALVFLGGIALGALVWRVNQGDIKMNAFLPDVESILANAAPGLAFHIENAVMESGGAGDLFAIRVYNITVQNDDSETIGNLQEMLLGFSWRNLARLSFVPSRLDIQRPSAQLTRFKDGHIGFNLKVAKGPDKKMDTSELRRMLLSAPDTLREIQIHDAWIQFIDQTDGASYEGQKGLLVLQRDNSRINGTLSMNVRNEKLDQPIRGTIDYDPAKKQTAINIATEGLNLDQLAFFLPVIPPELKIDMSFNVLATAVIDADFRLISTALQLAGGKGGMSYAPYWPDEIALSDVAAVLRYNTLKDTMVLENAHFVFGKAIADLQAVVQNSPDDTRKIAMIGTLRDTPVSALSQYWPQELAHSARHWVTTHLSEGTATQAGIELAGSLSADNKMTVQSLAGKIEFNGVTVNYLPPMPEVKHVDGAAAFDQDNFDIALRGGKVFDTNIRSGNVHISDLSKERQHMDIKLDLDGALRDAIQIIASKPLEYPQRLGLMPDQFTGRALTQLQLRFPLLNNLTLDQVEINTTAQLTDIAVKSAVKDLTLASAMLDFSADTEQLHITGPAKLADAAIDLDWQEYFNNDAPFATVISAKGDLTPALLVGLRLPVTSYVSGKGKVQAEIKQDRTKTMSVKAAADLAGIGITIPELTLTKPAAEAGSLSLDVASQKNGDTTLSNLNASWPQLQVKDGTVTWNRDLELESATLKDVRSGRTRGNFVVIPSSGVTRVTASGDVIDLSGYWTKSKDPAEKPSTQRLDITLDARTLYLDPEVPLQNVKGNLSLKGSELIHGRLSAKVDQGDLQLMQGENGDGSRQLSITAKNAGRIFQALDITDKVTGGNLSISGKSTDQAPAALTGDMTITDFSIRKAPVLARLINSFSVSGLIDLLNGQGLQFSKMQSNFALEQPQTIRLKNGRMTGSSLGLSFSGRVYRDKQTVNLTGNIIPMQGLNKFVSKIPLIGQILTGIKGEGLIGARYKIKGATADPEVTVNPLSVLTPGILRSIFFESGDD